MKKIQIKRVLVAIKPWETGLPIAANHARVLAQTLEAELIVMSSVFDSQVATGVARADPDALAAESGLIAAEQRTLDGLAQSLRDWGAVVHTRVVWHRIPHEAILKEVERSGADLLVIGAHERQPRLHSRFTDTDWQLMRLCPCPLLLVKDPGFKDYETILATIDPLHRHEGSAGLDHVVLETASLLRKAFGSKLYAVHAYPDPEHFALASSVEVLPGVFYGTENMESVHRRAAEETVHAYGIGSDEVELRPGKPVDVIAEVAADRRAKLVIIGALKRSRLEQALLGSTAEAAAAEVACDVLLVKSASMIEPKNHGS